jgi:Rhodopirellula transposase DDE domain
MSQDAPSAGAWLTLNTASSCRPTRPPSPGNKVEHCLFSFVTMNWRGKPLRTYETVVSLIGNTTNSGGLVAKASIDRRRYPTGERITPKQMRELGIDRNDSHGDWNYTVHPRPRAT